MRKRNHKPTLEGPDLSIHRTLNVSEKPDIKKKKKKIAEGKPLETLVQRRQQRKPPKRIGKWDGPDLSGIQTSQE
jgi:hypothetical protein